jgi:hypothetical protein
MRHSIKEYDAEARVGLGAVLLGAALIGSVLVLAYLRETPRTRARGRGRLRLQDRGAPEQPNAEEEGIPVLHEVVQPEELQQPPPEPPVLTDEVVPGRRSR